MKARRSRPWVRAALVFGVLATPCAARAGDDRSESDALILQGVELRRAGKNGEALEQFQKAYALVPTPRARVQIALALQSLGDWLGAERGLEQGLESADDPWIAEYRETIDGALATVRAHLARLFVEVDVTHGELLLNGVVVHALPLSDAIRVIAGDLDVEARAEGYVPVRRAVHVEAGKDVHETFHLEPLPPPAPPAARTAPPSERRRSVPAAISLGSAGALATGGVVAWRIREDNVATYNNDKLCLVGTVTRGQRCGSYATTADAALGVEIGAFTGAAIAAGFSAWFFWTPAKHSSTTARGFCGPSGLLGVSCAGRF